MINEYTLKQVIIIRKDLKLPKGKLCVQVAHAAVSAYIETKKIKPEWAEKWIQEGQKKIVVKVNNLEELEKKKTEADGLGLPNSMIIDAGLTVLKPGTTTCLGIGPAPVKLIDKVTGDLKLL
ncbi:MAG: peptidyl-tRNA hydrolase Pth2 [Candidatus Njordarchaeia archaeon]